MPTVTLYTSLIASVVVQVATGILEVVSVFIKVPLRFLLKQMMMLEIVVQIVEGFFYAHWLYDFKHISNITPRRYFDWIITTPTMLVNLIFYLIFLRHLNDDLDFLTLFRKEFYTIVTILSLNWAMLLCGYLGEISAIPILPGVLLGFIPFLIYYFIIFKKYAVFSNDGLKMFFYFFLVWSLYGVVAVLPYTIKNMCYNILDLFSKNFFGLFLSYLIISNKF